ncbi:MAG TPA: DUF2232 domain-containing protein [Rhodospirillaceae bacterium]|nr:DUF2232 domain-containing protein [Rhodospirillaceae bacterium]
MAKGLGLAVAAGFASALVFLSVLSGGAVGVFLAYVTPLPVVLVGLSFGLRAFAVSAVLALAVIALVAPPTALAFVVVALLPATVLVRQSLLWRQGQDGAIDWYPPGLILAWLAVTAVALTVFGAALVVVPGTGVEAMAEDTVRRFVEEVGGSLPPDVKTQAVVIWSALFPAMLSGAWFLMASVNGALGQWVAARAGYALRPTPSYSRLDLPNWLMIGLLAVAGLGFAAGGDAGYLARNAAVTLLWPFALAGLALVHRVLQRRSQAGLLLALFYLVFFAMFGWSLVAVAGIGLVSHWTKLRRHPAGSGQEEE